MHNSNHVRITFRVQFIPNNNTQIIVWRKYLCFQKYGQFVYFMLVYMNNHYSFV